MVQAGMRGAGVAGAEVPRLPDAEDSVMRELMIDHMTTQADRLLRVALIMRLRHRTTVQVDVCDDEKANRSNAGHFEPDPEKIERIRRAKALKAAGMRTGLIAQELGVQRQCVAKYLRMP